MGLSGRVWMEMLLLQRAGTASVDELRATYRILDANANRASEGLRTLEEIARMVLDHASLSQRLKELRHDLQSSVGLFDTTLLLQARNTAEDVGTSIDTVQEWKRSGMMEVAQAASGRLQQSLRCLEEFSKLVDVGVSHRFSRIRYLAYDLCAEAILVLGQSLNPIQTMVPDWARLYLLVDCQLPIDSFEVRLADVCRSGVDMVQIRDKSVDDRVLLAYAQRAKGVVDALGKFLVINDRVDIAMMVKAHGVHVGQEDLPIEEVRRIVGNSMWVGVSTHDMEQAKEAVAAGASYIGCGPTFPSSTKSFQDFAGTDFLRAVHEHFQVPAFAIGGIHRENLEAVLQTGVHRVALQHAIWNANDPAVAACDLAKMLQVR